MTTNDVQIFQVNNAGFIISTTREKYRIVRNCLSVMENDEELKLPVHYISEVEGKKMSEMFKNIIGRVPPFLIEEEGLSPRMENHFIVPGCLKPDIGTNLTKMMELAEKVASKFRSLYLSVEIDRQGYLSEEEYFLYTIVVASVAAEIAKIPDNHEVWEGIPRMAGVILRTGEYEALKQAVECTPPLMSCIVDLLAVHESHVKEVFNTQSVEDFKIEWEKDNRKALNSLNLNPPKTEALQIIQIMQRYHKS